MKTQSILSLSNLEQSRLREMLVNNISINCYYLLINAADIYCYTCNDSRLDPELASHLATFSSAEETKEFHALLAHLMEDSGVQIDDDDENVKMDEGDKPSPSEETFKERRRVFEEILKFINEEAKEPILDLEEIVMRSSVHV